MYFYFNYVFINFIIFFNNRFDRSMSRDLKPESKRSYIKLFSRYICVRLDSKHLIAQQDRVDRGLYCERWTWAVVHGTLHVSGMRNA